jgi:hypothetical protein
MDLRDELEQAIGHGPALPAPEERLRAGRAAVRRRRLAVGVGALAVTTALLAPFAASGGSGSRGVDPAPPVSRPSGPPDVPPNLEAGRVEPEPDHRTYTAQTYPWRGDTVAAIDFGGDEPLIRPGATVLDRRDDLFPGSGSHSVALVVRFEEQRYWVAMDWTEAGGTIGQDEAGGAFDGFDEFVADFVSGGPTTQGPPVGPEAGADRELEVVVVDGVPQLASEFSSVIIGPVVRGSEPYVGPRAYGLQVRLEGERSFVLLLQAEDGGWRVHRLVTAEPRQDLATWLRGAGWLPTGEEVSY